MPRDKAGNHVMLTRRELPELELYEVAAAW